jgi:hypothetical protein
MKREKENIRMYKPWIVLNAPWDCINMDFLLGVSRTHRGHDFIFLVVDRFSKMEFYSTQDKW